MLLRRLLLGLALVLLTAGGASYLHGLRDLVPVVVTARAVPAHTALTADLLTVRQVNRAALATLGAHAIGRIEDAAGLVTRMDLPAGEPVRREPWLVNVLADGADPAAARYQIPDGMRLAGLRVDAAGSVGRLITPGDRVDLILTSKPGAAGDVTARTILQGVEVFSAGAQSKTAPGAPAAGPSSDMNSSLDVTLLVTPEQAQLLSLAKRSGGALDLSLTPPGAAPANLPAATLPGSTPAPATAPASSTPRS